jgi:hypothetical protein
MILNHGAISLLKKGQSICHHKVYTPLVEGNNRQRYIIFSGEKSGRAEG